MAAHDPARRKLISSLGGLEAAIQSDPHERGHASVRARQQRCYEATDASLPEAERQRLAGLAFRAQMQRIKLGQRVKALQAEEPGLSEQSAIRRLTPEGEGR